MVGGGGREAGCKARFLKSLDTLQIWGRESKVDKGRASFSTVLYTVVPTAALWLFYTPASMEQELGAKRPAPAPCGGTLDSTCVVAGLGVDPVGTDGGRWATG